MKLVKHYILLLTVLLMSVVTAQAQETDSVSEFASQRPTLRISVLTCTAAEDLYAKFGHTALRVKDEASANDWVFNYGCFNYHAESFVWKFILGQTDYLLEAEQFEYFMYRYRKMGVGVTEQVLNLTPEETQRLWEMLAINIAPQNQEYRYKWIGNNCTNKVQYLLEDLMKEEGGQVVYAADELEGKTIRDLLHEKLEKSPWASFGIDMILGQEIDGAVKGDTLPGYQQRRRMFLPSVYMCTIDHAMLEDAEGERKMFVTEKMDLLAPTFVDEASTVVTPLIAFVILLLVVAGISILDYRKGMISIWLDMLLAALQGLSGILVAFLFFFSEHPGVDSNWLVCIFNPIPLFYAVWLYVCETKKKENKLAWANVAVLAVFILTMWLCPQSFNPAMYVVALALLVRAIAYMILTRKLRCNEQNGQATNKA